MPGVSFAIDEVFGEEPDPEPPKPHGFVVKVQRDINGLYSASWGSHCKSLVALSMATALRWLANEIEAQGLHGTTEEQLAGYVLDPHTLCKYCLAPIFFAHMPKPSEKFCAFDVQPIDGKKVKGERVATFGHTIDARGRLTVTWTMRGEGPVWIPHGQTCGDQHVAPEHAAYRERWEQSHGASVVKKDRVVERLRDIIRNIGELGHDDDNDESDISRP